MRKIGSPSSKDKAKEECLLRAGCRDYRRAQALARHSRHVDGGHERMGRAQTRVLGFESKCVPAL
jgi:hypothetical protein